MDITKKGSMPPGAELLDITPNTRVFFLGFLYTEYVTSHKFKVKKFIMVSL